MVEPRQEHWVAATKHVLRYLRGIVEYGLRYLRDGEVKFQGYIDSNWAGSATKDLKVLGLNKHLYLAVLSFLPTNLAIECIFALVGGLKRPFSLLFSAFYFVL
jgi:hypothetical protein